jgi:ethanolamine utilization cobalamin adenosyltransferase
MNCGRHFDMEYINTADRTIVMNVSNQSEAENTLLTLVQRSNGSAQGTIQNKPET